MDSRRTFTLSVCLVLWLAGCVGPIEREHGYPRDWPDPLATSKGFAEINGAYANHGTLFSTDTGFEEITLASLIPDDLTFGNAKGGVPVPNPRCSDCVVLRIRPGSTWSPSPTLQATIPAADGARQFDVEIFSGEELLRYALLKPASAGRYTFGTGQGTRLALTVAADRSLIVRIGSGNDFLTGEILVAPEYFAKYFWARFERLGD
jgi:hypothetical protein